MPFWSADGSRVLFWSAAGVSGVPVEGGAASFEADTPLGTHLGGRFTTEADGDTVVLTRTADGASWTLDTGGATIAVSVDGTHAAWVEGLESRVPGRATPPMTHRLADLTTEPAAVESVEAPSGYAMGDWTAGGGWLMSLMDRGDDRPALIRFDPETGETLDLFDGQRLRTGRSSPDRTWIAITRTYEPDAADNAVYIVSSDGLAPPRRLDLAGGYRWRDDDRLLMVPQVPGDGGMELWEIDAASGAAQRLELPPELPPEQPPDQPPATPFRIAAGEWSVAPTGEHVAFRSAVDDAIWVMELPR